MIRQAVAMARLVGVAASVHVGEIEGPDGAQRAGGREEFADRPGAAQVDAENVLAAREESADVFRVRDALLEKSFVHLGLGGRTIRGEIRKMHDESGAEALPVRIEREELHPARIDADERLVGGRRQAGDRPVMTLGPARNRDAALAVESDYL